MASPTTQTTAARTEQAREAAQAETDKVLAALEGPHPEAVTVKAVHGFPVNELIDASKDADMVVWVGGVRADSPGR